MRKTKIVCTLGPATDKEDVLEQLIASGMNVARLNFSHGDYKEHKARMDKVKELRKKYNTQTAIMLDTKGPEIRLGLFEQGEVILKENQKFTLYCTEHPGNEEGVSITYQDLYQDVAEGTMILIDDGLVEMQVDEIKDKAIVCTVKNGGKISGRKGVNVPNVKLSMPFLSEKDKEDILFGIQEDVDFIAASFVRRADDIHKMRKYLNDHGGYDIHIIAKIENMEGVTNIDDILEAAEGVMVARGDMGVEIPYEEVPVIQKMIIKKGVNLGKQIITATQMLDSMMKNPRPTRAETTDVANAIYDGTGAIMLSGETAAGLYPVESLLTMIKIADRTEQDIDYGGRMKKCDATACSVDITTAISHATCTTAMDLNAAAIITVTMSGFTAGMISRYKPGCPIIGCSVNPRVCRQLNLSWGVAPLLIEREETADDLFDEASRAAEKAGYVKKGDIVVLTAGVPLGTVGTTNMIRVIEI